MGGTEHGTRNTKLVSFLSRVPCPVSRLSGPYNPDSVLLKGLPG